LPQLNDETFPPPAFARPDAGWIFLFNFDVGRSALDVGRFLLHRMDELRRAQRHPLDANLSEHVSYSLGFERLDDRFDFFHRAKLEAALQSASRFTA
jgi:hypothetical protein